MALVAIFGVVATSLPAVADDLIADIQKRGNPKSWHVGTVPGQCVTKKAT